MTSRRMILGHFLLIFSIYCLFSAFPWLGSGPTTHIGWCLGFIGATVLTYAAPALSELIIPLSWLLRLPLRVVRRIKRKPD